MNYNLNIDETSTELLLRLAKAGNMAALDELVARRRQAEAAATVYTVRLVLGQEGLGQLFESIRRLTAQIATVERVGKTSLAKEADRLELQHAIANPTSPQTARICKTSRGSP